MLSPVLTLDNKFKLNCQAKFVDENWIYHIISKHSIRAFDFLSGNFFTPFNGSRASDKPNFFTKQKPPPCWMCLGSFWSGSEKKKKIMLNFSIAYYRRFEFDKNVLFLFLRGEAILRKKRQPWKLKEKRRLRTSRVTSFSLFKLRLKQKC